jgi:hypothetical protein
MRQGGFKPKSHSSGVYWVRANAKTGGGKKSANPDDDDSLTDDLNGDGIVSTWEKWVRPAGWITGAILSVIFITIGIVNSP